MCEKHLTLSITAVFSPLLSESQSDRAQLVPCWQHKSQTLYNNNNNNKIFISYNTHGVKLNSKGDTGTAWPIKFQCCPNVQYIIYPISWLALAYPNPQYYSRPLTKVQPLFYYGSHHMWLYCWSAEWPCMFVIESARFCKRTIVYYQPAYYLWMLDWVTGSRLRHWYCLAWLQESSNVMIVVFSLNSITIWFCTNDSTVIQIFSPQYSELKI